MVIIMFYSLSFFQFVSSSTEIIARQTGVYEVARILGRVSKLNLKLSDFSEVIKKVFGLCH